MRWIERLKQNDKTAFEEVYRLYHGKVYGFVYKQTRDCEKAEDLTHDVFFRLWEKRALLSVEKPLDPQLFTIAKHIVINHYKREVKRGLIYKELAQDPPSEDMPPLFSVDPTQRIEAAIEGLPNRRREIFKLSRFGGLTYEEIASELRISKSTVEVQMVKALSYLRSHLANITSLVLIGSINLFFFS